VNLKKKMAIAAVTVSAAFALAAPAQAALLGQTISYCTDSTYSGAPSLDPGVCDFVSVFTSGTATIVDPGTEITLGGNRFVDFTNSQIIITYDVTSSPSPDLYVITGLSGITGLNRIIDSLGVEAIFSGTAIGLLVSGNPSGPGRAVFNVLTGTPAVPEMSTWAMMIAGFGLVGMAMRRRTRTQITFA